MNANEPVAWMSNGQEFYVQKNYCPDFIPLYIHPASLVDWSYQQGYQVGKETHPAKTLTDEEDTECQYCKQGCIRCDARKTLTDRIAELEKQVGIWEKESMNARIKMSLYQAEIKELRKAKKK